MNVLDDARALALPNHLHHTWARTYFCRPELYFQPSSVDQLQTIVRAANLARKTLMLTGAGHSPSDMTMTSQWLVNLDRFNSALSFSRHESGLFTDVRVEAGIRIYQLNAVLASRGLALQNLGSISEQSIAGLISTGTHGSSAFHGLLSQQVVDITILLASGDLVTVSPATNPDLFRAALLSLGKLGIITHVTVRSIPSFTVHSFQEIVDFDTLKRDWESIWTSKEYVRVWWYPYSRKCILWRAEKSHKQLSAPRHSFYEGWLGRTFLECLFFIGVSMYPPAMPAIERFVFKLQYGWDETYNTGGSEAVQNSVEGLNMDCLFHQFVNEWALPLAPGVAVLDEIDTLVSAACASHEYYVHAPIEVRCSNCSVPYTTPASPFSVIESFGIGPIPGNTLRPLLDYSPTLPYADSKPITNENLTLYINATMYRPFAVDPPIAQWYAEFENVMVKYHGKPHWAKNFVGEVPSGPLVDITDNNKPVLTGSGLAAVFSTWYGGDGALFKKLRESVDPTGLFLGGKDWAIRNGII
ncbi:D-arabinono-1,4-lactone oxidase-domain-containing protein [Limtongia smithiae]|uniref:D-arabinono-1,4-lactone oxidase-domain-containing protein n=1 Tax=Limtongia smithiae TaxID=1125753 RepID=UPI0034CF6596